MKDAPPPRQRELSELAKTFCCVPAADDTTILEASAPPKRSPCATAISRFFLSTFRWQLVFVVICSHWVIAILRGCIGARMSTQAKPREASAGRQASEPTGTIVFRGL